VPGVSLLLLLQHLLPGQDDLVDEEAPELAGHRVALLLLPLVLLAQLQDLLDLVPLKPDIRLEALPRRAVPREDCLGLPVGQSRAFQRPEMRDFGLLHAGDGLEVLLLLDDGPFYVLELEQRSILHLVYLDGVILDLAELEKSVLRRGRGTLTMSLLILDL
jgi:hypothetical protein